MLSDFSRKSVGHVLRAPMPDHEFYVFVARYWPEFIEADEGDVDATPFDRWDQDLAPSPALIEEYDPTEPWAAWARQYIAEVGRETIHRRAAHHAEAAGDRTVVFVCYEGEDQHPRCHTWSILDVLAGQRQTGLNEY